MFQRTCSVKARSDNNLPAPIRIADARWSLVNQIVPHRRGVQRRAPTHITSRRIRDKKHPEHTGDNQAASNYGYLPSRTYLLKHRKTLQQFCFSNATSWVGINAVL
jgi:hypothetical protein